MDTILGDDRYMRALADIAAVYMFYAYVYEQKCDTNKRIVADSPMQSMLVDFYKLAGKIDEDDWLEQLGASYVERYISLIDELKHIFSNKRKALSGTTSENEATPATKCTMTYNTTQTVTPSAGNAPPSKPVISVSARNPNKTYVSNSSLRLPLLPLQSSTSTHAIQFPPVQSDVGHQYFLKAHKPEHKKKALQILQTSYRQPNGVCQTSSFGLFCGLHSAAAGYKIRSKTEYEYLHIVDMLKGLVPIAGRHSDG